VSSHDRRNREAGALVGHNVTRSIDHVMQPTAIPRSIPMHHVQPAPQLHLWHGPFSTRWGMSAEQRQRQFPRLALPSISQPATPGGLHRETSTAAPSAANRLFMPTQDLRGVLARVMNRYHQPIDEGLQFLGGA
jgi:hypothetical protein